MRRPKLWLIIACLLAYTGVSVVPAWLKVTKASHGRDFATYHYAVQVAAEGEDPYSKKLLGKAARREKQLRLAANNEVGALQRLLVKRREACDALSARRASLVASAEEARSVQEAASQLTAAVRSARVAASRRGGGRASVERSSESSSTSSLSTDTFSGCREKTRTSFVNTS